MKGPCYILNIVTQRTAEWLPIYSQCSLASSASLLL